MKSRQAIRALAGVLLCGLGLWLAVPTPYREKTYLVDAGGCRMETTVAEKSAEVSQGSVVLFHGISANKKIMSYLARGFAEQNLRVYVPDFPGHGRTPGPFSAERAERCAEALLRELLARGVIRADRTILAGHSMGGAIALRIASRVSVAGVMAISAAPMQAAAGGRPAMLLFKDSPPLPNHSLVMSGSLEPESMRGNGADLLASSRDGSSKYVEMPGATHVSVLFSAATVHASQEWSAQILHLIPATRLPSHVPLLCALAGFLGLLLITGPFLREATGRKPTEEIIAAGAIITDRRLFLEWAASSFLIVVILRLWNPLKVIRVFEGDYLASFLLLLGMALIAAHWNSVRTVFASSPRRIQAAPLAGLSPLPFGTPWLALP